MPCRAPLLMLSFLAGALAVPACSEEDFVAPPVVTQITLSTANCGGLQVNTTCQLVARAIDADGEEITDARLRWMSENITIATVNFEGVVTGLREGPATIRVETLSGLVSAETTVVVRAAPDPCPVQPCE